MTSRCTFSNVEIDICKQKWKPWLYCLLSCTSCESRMIIRIALYIHSIDPSHLFFFFKWRNSCLLEKFLIDYWTHLGRVENWVYTLQKNTSIGNVICFSNKKLTIFLCARWTRQTPNMFECCENCVRTLTADLMSDFEAAINCSLMAEVLYIFSFWRCFINKMN